MFTYALIKTDDTIEVCESVKRPEYDDINTAVGGWIEGVPVRDDVTAYINEEGKLMGLPVNRIATALAHTYRGISPQDYIAGNMIVFGALDEDGEITSLSPKFIPSMMVMFGITQDI